ncbi:phosphoglycerate dehydrogenase-like oxidoreductase [Methanolobus tindarius DSM 2278]|uniref:Phosphoglycerate dehydrogenase-like oxidoreductase n=1 Tax=Methanolobus tindarius DSM 2278 TaxID=1090322 RepID=W9DQ83_METTI|nr:phosphoglycerate dehydrogenase [Methanolobus tindarius]ETA67455.1 phosphoglycerate dehydrogenase-like oxidoreductase [Methanolobus tindarius DSM 2278]
MYAKIAITIRSFSSIDLLSELLKNHGEVKYINTSGKRLGEDELCHILEDFDGVIAGTEKFSSKVLESSPKLRVISRVGVGVDSIDQEAAKKQGISILNTPEAPALAVAEHTLALTFAVIKRIATYNENMRDNNFTIESGLLLAGKTVGVIGLGRVGRRVAEMFEMLGCNILFYDPFLPVNFISNWKRVDSLDYVLKKADIITLHVPPQSDGKPLIGSNELNVCKSGMVLINTSRGSLVDENALAKAIESGVVWGAGLDVFPVEPYSGKLLDFPQVVATPHVASNTIESRQQMEKEAINNLLAKLRDL